MEPRHFILVLIGHEFEQIFRHCLGKAGISQLLRGMSDLLDAFDVTQSVGGILVSGQEVSPGVYERGQIARLRVCASTEEIINLLGKGRCKATPWKAIFATFAYLPKPSSACCIDSWVNGMAPSCQESRGEGCWPAHDRPQALLPASRVDHVYTSASGRQQFDQFVRANPNIRIAKHRTRLGLVQVCYAACALGRKYGQDFLTNASHDVSHENEIGFTACNAGLV